MANKTKQKMRRVKQPKQKSSPKARPTPFADVGNIVGKQVGHFFGMPGLQGVGKWLGSGIGSIFGSGDYQIVGEKPAYNLLMNNQIPKFSSTDRTNIVCHREYLGDILGTSGFSNITYPLNPGMSQTFPWLSTIAQNYQEYKFHGLIFEFRPLITDFVTSGAPGVMVMATNYNSDQVAYTSRVAMENSEYAVSVKPTRELVHGIECGPGQTVLPQLYVRTGTVPVGQDLRLYDLGLTQIATQANPTQDIGELWVSYCVEFFKPILAADIGANISYAHAGRSTFSAANPLGTIGLVNQTNMTITITSTTITFPAQTGQKYLVELSWGGSVAGVATYPGVTFTNCAATGNYNNQGTAFEYGPQGGITTKNMVNTFLVVSTTTYAGQLITITFDGTGVYPTGSTTIDIVVTEVDSSAT
jgi:hypothetical protein